MLRRRLQVVSSTHQLHEQRKNAVYHNELTSCIVRILVFMSNMARLSRPVHVCCPEELFQRLKPISVRNGRSGLSSALVRSSNLTLACCPSIDQLFYVAGRLSPCRLSCGAVVCWMNHLNSVDQQHGVWPTKPINQSIAILALDVAANSYSSYR